MPETNPESGIRSSAHHSALFFIQPGILVSDSAAIIGFDVDFDPCTSTSNVKKPKPALGAINSGPIPLINMANDWSPGSPCNSQCRSTFPPADQKWSRPSSLAAECMGIVLPSTISTLKMS